MSAEEIKEFTEKDVFSLNEAKLLNYLQNECDVFKNQVQMPTISRFTYGQSNPTYLIQGRTKSIVLRKKPPGQLLPSAHQMGREYKIIKSLQNTNIPVPSVFNLCEDESVLGTPFYTMEYVTGPIFKNANLESLKPHERQEIYLNAAETMGKLHLIKPLEVGLSDYGKPFGYCKRQVERWWKQYKSACYDEEVNPKAHELKKWLSLNIPSSDFIDEDNARITHGDFSLSNLIYNKTNKGWKIRAILDWELSTIGDPWSDVAYFCLPFYLPKNALFEPLKDPLPDGITTEKEFVLKYCSVTDKIEPSEKDWVFYKSLSLFRTASICQGIHARNLQGNAISKKAEIAGNPRFISDLIERALRLIVNLKDETISIFNGSWPHVNKIKDKLQAFMDTHVFPNEVKYDHLSHSNQIMECIEMMESLKEKAKNEGLWNLFMSASLSTRIKDFLDEEVYDGHMTEIDSNAIGSILGQNLTNLQYAPISEIMGQCIWAPEIFNCSAPDTGNMELLIHFGTREQKRTWLIPLLKGEIRSCFGMTEKSVASSDANNIQSSIEKTEKGYICNGCKWWTSGALHPKCEICIFMGKTNPRAKTHRQQSMILIPMDTKGIEIVRPMMTFGYNDQPFGHPEIQFKNIMVPLKNILGEEGNGFVMAQLRLGPGRLHHCMRLVGIGERVVKLMKQRALERYVNNKPLADKSSVQQIIAECIIDVQTSRLLVLNAANELDKKGNKEARVEIACAKAYVPKTIQKVIDRGIQIHGGAGFSDDTPLARMFITARTLRVADGPDEVHLTSIGKYELFKRVSKM